MNDGFWLVPGRQRPFIDSHFTEIDERRIVRNEDKGAAPGAALINYRIWVMPV